MKRDTQVLAPIEYLYRPLYRPAHFAGLPKGWDYVEAPACEPDIAVRRGLPLSRQTYGIIAYTRPLTKQEQADHQLEPC